MEYNAFSPISRTHDGASCAFYSKPVTHVKLYLIHVQVILSDLTNVTQDLMHYFDTRGGTTLITTLPLNHQEAIRILAAENVIDKDHGLGSNYGPPDLQTDTLAVELSRFCLINVQYTGLF